jgi:HK97 family phage major capsid protein
MNVKDQIEALKRTRAEKAARLEAITQKTIDESRTKDEAEREEYNTARDEIKAIDLELKDLEELEEIQVKAAAPVEPRRVATPAAAANARDPASVKNTQKLEPGIKFARFAMCLGAARGDHERAFKLAKSRFPDNEDVVNVLRAQAESGVSLSEMIEKANVNGGTTQDTTWAAPLVQYQDFAGDFIDYLRPMTIVGKFGAGNIPGLTRVPFNVRIAGQSSGGTAAWVGEGKPKPLTKFDFTSTTVPFTKVAAISVVTEELLRFSSPSADRLVRDGLAGAVIARLDIDFIDPGKAAVANVSPASILNGVTPIAPTGTGDADDIRKDIRSLWAPFIAANNPPTTAVYIMTATTALALSMMTNTLGQLEFPGLTMAGGTLNGVPVIVSEYLDNSAGSAGGLVVLVNARDVWLADDGGVTIDLSREASLQMDDSPTNAADTGTEASLVSMWQTNSVAFRAEREIYWAKRRSTAAQYLDGVQWGQIGPDLTR